MGDYPAWAELRAQSRDFLTLGAAVGARRTIPRLVPPPPAPIPARAARGRGLRLAHLPPPGDLVGGLTLSNVRRGVAQSCSVGYWIGATYANAGYMTEAVRAVIPFAFDQLGLHRLEAACLPPNAASLKLLEKTGFKREGIARRYLKINGVWQDHVLYALLDTDTHP